MAPIRAELVIDWLETSTKLCKKVQMIISSVEVVDDVDFYSVCCCCYCLCPCAPLICHYFESRHVTVKRFYLTNYHCTVIIILLEVILFLAFFVYVV